MIQHLISQSERLILLVIALIVLLVLVLYQHLLQSTGLEVHLKVALVQDLEPLGVTQDITLTHLVVVMRTQIDYVYMVMVLVAHMLDSITSYTVMLLLFQ